MSPRVVDRVDDWDQRPFSGGAGALADLSTEEFSGVVRAGGAELYMTGGTVVAVRRGTVEEFEDASGTAFEAPDPALSLLAVMQEQDVDVRAEYYSEETPISEIDRTLSDGGFTGYVELSENVLSGDYYVVYQGGTSTSVAYVGASERLITGEEAFETADDEVGIYKVRQVDVDPIEIPEPPGATEDEESGDADETGETTGDADEAGETTGDAEESGDADDQDAEATLPEKPAPEETRPDEDAGTTASSTPEESVESDRNRTGEAAAAGDATSGGQTGSAGGSRRTASTAEESAGRTSGRGTESGADAVEGVEPAPERGTDGRSRRQEAGGDTRGQAGDLETRGVPSLDPDHTTYPQRSTQAPPDPPAQGREPPKAGEASTEGGAGQRAGGGGPAEHGERAGGSPDRPAEQGARSTDAGNAELADLEAELADREAEIEELESELERARDEREDLEVDLAAVREERDELQSEADRLRQELERLEEELGAATDAERRMTPGEAIEGTNLFVDYESKGNATLEKAHGGSDAREDVRDNLQLGVHTEFDDRSVAVGGQAFGEFLRSTIQYRFAEWLIGDLLFEIRDTGHAEALTDLYAAIPEIRRVEFDGTVDVEYVEDGEERTATEAFDVIFRHRMGDPLVVANLNDSRDPATGDMMTSLVTAAERVGQSEESLAGAFLVTSSYFESEALETVAGATKGGILSRDKRTSFVNLSRKTGYHLCLVAAREGNFHMEVPEL